MRLHESEVIVKEAGSEGGLAVLRCSSRFRVSGGWLYRLEVAMGKSDPSLAIAQTFVPDSVEED